VTGRFAHADPELGLPVHPAPAASVRSRRRAVDLDAIAGNVCALADAARGASLMAIVMPCGSSRTRLLRIVGIWSHLTTSHDTQGGDEPVADQCVDVRQVGRSEPTGDAYHGVELIKSSAAPLAGFEVLFDAPSLAFVHLAVEVLGQAVD
jgi:hypothetical protein